MVKVIRLCWSTVEFWPIHESQDRNLLQQCLHTEVDWFPYQLSLFCQQDKAHGALLNINDNNRIIIKIIMVVIIIFFFEA